MGRAILVLAGALLACRAEVSSEQTRAAPQPLSAVAQILIGSTDEGNGSRAWLVRLDSAGGALYHPPGALRLLPVGNPEGGGVALRSEPAVGGGVYTFQDADGSDGFRGTVSFAPDRRAPGPPAGSWPVQLAPVRTRPVAPWGVGGVYTGAQVNEHTGDLGGYELVVLADSAGIRAILTDYGEDGVPYAGEVSRAEGEWWLALRAPGGQQRYGLRPTDETVTLTRTGATPEEAVVLRRRGDVADAFRPAQR